MSIRTVSKLVHWALLVTAVVTVVSGLGITEYQAVGTLTFGLLNKASAFKLHLWTWIPFLVLLAAHALLTGRQGRLKNRR